MTTPPQKPPLKPILGFLVGMLLVAVAWTVVVTLMDRFKDDFPRPLIVAHRGASLEAPENTLAAVRLAWEQGAPAVEVDVLLSADNRVMVHHDDTTGRLSDPDLRISQTHSDELRALDVGRWKAFRFENERIPFLEEVLATVPPHGTLYIEIKGPTATADQVVKLVSEMTPEPSVVLISFDVNPLLRAKELQPDIPAYIVLESESAMGAPISPEWIRRAKEMGLDGLDCAANSVTEDFIAQAHAEGLVVAVWTVDSALEARKLASWGIDAITTNDPAGIMGSFTNP